jgi:FMN phosphatase YigB (HAD superfamily)
MGSVSDRTSMYKLRTIDVWDTILRRKSSPDFSKLISARALVLMRRDEIDTAYADHWAIYNERCLIESDLTNLGGGEYALEDVLERTLGRVLKSGSGDRIALVRQLAQLEFEFELRNTYIDSDVFDFVARYPAEQTIFLSDFYMSADKLKQLLRYHGIMAEISDGISSCDVGLNKRSGHLFTHVHAAYGISPSEHVHIGDNLRADVEMPRQLGVEAVHFEPRAEHFRRLEKAEFANDRAALFRHISNEVEAAAADEAAALKSGALQAFRLGLSAAPLLVGFILFVAECALSDELKYVYFFTREGEFFLDLWRQLFPNNKLAGVRLPEVELLEVSRIATFCGSLREPSIAEMMRLWNLYSTQSPAALLKSLSLDPREFERVCRCHNLALDEEIVYPWADVRMQALFDDGAFIEPIREKSQRDRQHLLGYLRQRGWPGDFSHVGIVDIGWRGSIQDNLAMLLPRCELRGYYLGLLRFLNPQPENCQKRAFGPDVNSAPDSQDLLAGVALLEMLCNSPRGSVTGYQIDELGTSRAVRLVDEAENKVFYDFTAYFQRGVLCAVARWAHFIDSHVISSSEFQKPGYEIWRRLVSNPQETLIEAHASLTYNELFGLGTFVDKRAVPSIGQLFRGLFDRRGRQRIILFIKQTPRAAVIWKRRDLGLAHRTLIAATLQTAWFCKRTLRRWKWR